MLERQADMNNSSHSSQTNTGSASFHDISLSSSASELNSSIQSVHSSSQGDAEQSSFYSSSSSSSNRPAATSSPTPQKMTEAERKASPQTHGLQPITNQSQLPGALQVAGVSQRDDTSQDFFESFGLSSSSYSNAPSPFQGQKAPSPNMHQHSIGAAFFDSFTSDQSSRNAPNASAQLFPPSGQAQRTTSSRNTSFFPEASTPAAPTPGMPPKGRTSQLFDSAGHNDSFDSLSQVSSKAITEQLNISTASVATVEAASNAPPTGPFASKAEPRSFVELASVQQTNTLSQKADTPTMPFSPMANAEAGASYPLGRIEMLQHPFQVGSNEIFNPTSTSVATSPMPPPALQMPEVGLPNIPLDNGGMTDHSFEQGLSSNPQSVQGQSSSNALPSVHVAQISSTITQEGASLSSPPVQHGQPRSIINLFGQEGKPHSSIELPSAQPFDPEGQQVIMSSPPLQNAQPSSKPSFGQEGKPHSSIELPSAQPFDPEGQQVIMSSPPLQNAQPSSKPSFGQEGKPHSYTVLPSAQPFDPQGQQVIISSPPMQNITFPTSTISQFGQKGASLPSFELPPLNPASQPVGSSNLAMRTANFFPGEAEPSSFQLSSEESFNPTSHPMDNSAVLSPPTQQSETSAVHLTAGHGGILNQSFESGSSQPHNPFGQSLGQSLSNPPVHGTGVSGYGGTSHPPLAAGYAPPPNPVGQLKNTPPMFFQSSPSEAKGGIAQVPQPPRSMQQATAVPGIPSLALQSAQVYNSTFPSKNEGEITQSFDPGFPSGSGNVRSLNAGLNQPSAVFGQSTKTPSITPTALGSQSNLAGAFSEHPEITSRVFQEHQVPTETKPVDTTPRPPASIQSAQINPTGYPFEHSGSIPFNPRSSHQDLTESQGTPSPGFPVIKHSDKTFCKELNLGTPDSGVQATGLKQSTVAPPTNAAHPPPVDASELQKTPSETSLTRVPSNHSAFESVPPSPRHSNMSLVEEDLCKTGKSPLRSPVEKEKKYMYPTSNVDPSSLWENGSKMSMPAGLILSSTSGQEVELCAPPPPQASTSCIATQVIQPDSAPSSVKPFHGPGPGAGYRIQPAPPSGSTSTATFPVASQPMVANVQRYDVNNENIFESRTPPAVKTDASHPVPTAGHRYSNQPALPSGSTSTAPYSVASQPMVSNVQRSDINNENILESRSPAVKTDSTHLPLFHGPNPGTGHHHPMQHVPPSSSTPTALKTDASYRPAQAVPLPSSQVAVVESNPQMTLGIQKPGSQVNQQQQPPSSREEHVMQREPSYYNQEALPGHGYDRREPNVQPDASRSDALLAGMHRNEHHQFFGTQPAMVDPGYGGGGHQTTTPGDNPGVPVAHGQAAMAEQGQHVTTADQQQR